MENITRLLIGGDLVATDQVDHIINPATEKLAKSVSVCTEDMLDDVVFKARSAFEDWSQKDVEHRRVVLRKIAAAIAENVDELRDLMVSEHGKPKAEAHIEMLGAAHWFAQYAEVALPKREEENSNNKLNRTEYVPLGVVGAIVPWNYPVFLASFKIAPALLAGNTVIWKPSPFTPVTSLRLGEILADIVPPGVLNVIHGPESLGPAMTAHPGIDKISYTGSTATGRRVMAGAAETLKHIDLELGGNDAAIVLSDVDIEEAAESVFWAAFRNSGQICIAAKRVYVPQDIFEPFVEAISDVAKRVKVGDGALNATQLGPIQNARQFERVKALIADIKSKKLTITAGGDIPDRPGYFVSPTIVVAPPDTSRIVTEEQFGPILPIMRYSSLSEVVVRANAGEFGLGATIWTNDLDTAEDLAGRLDVGTVWVNEAHSLSPHTPFAGHKKSGIGVVNGEDGLMTYLQAKTIIVNRKSGGYRPAVSKADALPG